MYWKPICSHQNLNFLDYSSIGWSSVFGQIALSISIFLVREMLFSGLRSWLFRECIYRHVGYNSLFFTHCILRCQSNLWLQSFTFFHYFLNWGICFWQLKHKVHVRKCFSCLENYVIALILLQNCKWWEKVNYCMKFFSALNWSKMSSNGVKW